MIILLLTNMTDVSVEAKCPINTCDVSLSLTEPVAKPLLLQAVRASDITWVKVRTGPPLLLEVLGLELS